MYIVCSLLGRLNLGSCASCQGKLERVCIIGLVPHPQELANEATFNNGFGIWCNLSNTQYFVLHEVYVSNPWLCTQLLFCFCDSMASSAWLGFVRTPFMLLKVCWVQLWWNTGDLDMIKISKVEWLFAGIRWSNQLFLPGSEDPVQKFSCTITLKWHPSHDF